MKIRVSESFKPLLDCTSRYLVLAGGRGSGKSEFAGRKVFYRCETEGNHRFLIMRKVRARTRQSVEQVMISILRQNGIGYDHNRTDGVITFANPSGATNTLLFGGLDDPEKIKSVKGITGAWIEEATEFTKEDFVKFDLSIREPGPRYLQIMLTFNPDESQAPWLKEMFFDRRDADATVHVSTIDDNPIPEMREAYRKQLDKIEDDVLLKIYRYGQWAVPTGRIFAWDVVPLPAGMTFDEIFYGGDFGFTVNPSTIVKIYRKADDYWIEEKLYQTGLTNDDLAAAAKALGITDADIMIFDSAERKSIEELRQRGLCVIGADKGPNSVKEGIDFLKSKRIHIVEGSTNLIKEARTYKWKQDGLGRDLPIPVKYDDHAIDAARYAITHMADISCDVGYSYVEVGAAVEDD